MGVIDVRETVTEIDAALCVIERGLEKPRTDHLFFLKIAACQLENARSEALWASPLSDKMCRLLDYIRVASDTAKVVGAMLARRAGQINAGVLGPCSEARLDEEIDQANWYLRDCRLALTDWCCGAEPR